MSRWLTSLLRHTSRSFRTKTRAFCWIGKRSLRILHADAHDHVVDLPDGLSVDGLAAWIADTAFARDAGEYWTVLLDASIAPMLEVDAAAVSLDEPAWQALAEHRFAAVLGASLGSYSVKLERYTRSVRIACAFPKPLVGALLGTAAHRTGRLSIVPALVHASSLTGFGLATPHWIVCITDESCQGAWRTAQRLHLGAPWPATVDQPLHTLLGQEAQLSGLGEQAAPFGHAVFIGKPPPALRAGWSEVLVASDVLGRRL